MLISTIGASIFLSNSISPTTEPSPGAAWLARHARRSVGPVYLDSQYRIIIGVTLALVAFQYWLLQRTLIGKNSRRRARTEMATLLGIPVAAMIMITFIYSAVLGEIAGILVAPVLFVSIQMGSTIALKAFAATMIGGFGDVAGAILGGLRSAIIETFGAAYISVPFKDAFAFPVSFSSSSSGRKASLASGWRKRHDRDSQLAPRQIAYALVAVALVALAAPSRPTAMSRTFSYRPRPTRSRFSAFRSYWGSVVRSISRRPRSSRSAHIASPSGRR